MTEKYFVTEKYEGRIWKKHPNPLSLEEAKKKADFWKKAGSKGIKITKMN